MERGNDQTLAVPIRSLALEGPYYAHTPPEGTDRWHLWVDHALSVGQLASGFGAPFSAEALCRLIGITHDAGKLAAEVQLALKKRAEDHGAKLGVPHKVEGAALCGLLLEAGNRGAAQAMAQANFGHHGGIPNGGDGRLPPIIGQMREDPRCLDDLVRLVEEQAGLDLRELADAVVLPGHINAPPDLELFTRLCHSALVDADFLDTEAHFRLLDGPRLGRERGMAALRSTFESAYRSAYENSTGELARLRWEYYDKARRFGAGPLPTSGGIYRLPAPTGSGKTMSAAAFALTHAAEHGKRRVVVAVPFTSITTQNAQAYRGMFRDLGDEVVLEHHSSILNEAVADSGWRRLAASNWDAEFIVTTTVQLLESLFSNRPSATRKLHRLVGSVIVIDEVQSLPIDLLPAILRMLKELTLHYGVTVLLASATQPALRLLEEWEDLEMVDLMPMHNVPEITERVSYDPRRDDQSWDEIADELAGEPQALVIVNTTADAQRLHGLIASRSDPDRTVRHLSTRMSNADRARVLDEVTELLRAGTPVVLVSTQVIEAGVDIDFPVVYRAMAPADSVVQSAGRCNREGKLPGAGGRVVVFQPEGGGLPRGAYARATKATRSLFIEQRDRDVAAGRTPAGFNDPHSMERYYASLYSERLGPTTRTKGVEINEYRDRLAFEETAKEFRLIEDTSVSVIVGWESDPELGELVDRLRVAGSFPSRAERRRLSAATASAPARLFQTQPALFDRLDSGVVLWHGEYDDQVGLVVDGGGEASIW